MTDSRLQFGSERSHDGASHTIVIQGETLRLIIDELRGHGTGTITTRADIDAAFAG